MIRRLRACENPVVVVQIEEGLNIALPCWMLDATCCETMVLEAQSRICVNALIQLRDLIDRQADEQNTVSGDSVVAEEHHNDPPIEAPMPNTDSAPTET